MEVHIKRVSRMWSWSNIKQHRENLKAYKKAYKAKLAGNKQNQENDLQIQVRHKHRELSLWESTAASFSFSLALTVNLTFSRCRTVTRQCL